jgi:hypothetical protein
MLCPRSPRVPLALLFATLAGFAPSARATLYVYEGFNGYTTGALAGQKPNANTVGLDTTVGYYDDGSNRTSGFSIQSTGLTLGSLQTGTGALAFSSGTFVIGADISQTAITGTLWSSYLINFSTNSAASGNGTLVRIGTTPADSGTNTRFTSWADSRNTSTNVGVAYNGATGTDGTAGLATGTTYIIISRFTNVGSTLTSGAPGTATLWAMTASQFNSFIAAGGTEVALESASVVATATQSTTTGGPFTFNSNSAFGIVAVGNVGVIDELRYGSALVDVTFTAIPEPAATTALVGLAAALCTVRRKRRA